MTSSISSFFRFLATYKEEEPEENLYVKIGNRVTYVDVEEPDKQLQVLIELGASNPSAGIISSRTPLAMALLDAEVGEKVTVKLPRGKQLVEIVAIE